MSLLLCFPFTKRGAAPSIGVWVGDGGVRGACWIKKLTVGLLIGIGKPSTFWKSDELLMQGNGVGLISYNLRTGKLRDLAINGMAGITRWAYFVREEFGFSAREMKLGCRECNLVVLWRLI
ncbi:hypothetical protein TIFTF001_003912 [Ficus carica]|uniref:Uncharacterized protein n=1 Tax=Ficus carica TaxID=3494 RepID=A0AA88CWW3_FICCA|nr:hypothetical protein TIFTF001_003912 [Ficus carica]